MAAAVEKAPPPPSPPPPPPPPPRPRLISEAPSARNLKPRRVSAVRRWPPGCGRFPAPPAPAPAPAPSSPAPSSPAPSSNTNPPAPDSPPVPLPVRIPSSPPVALAAANTVVADSHHASPSSPPPPPHSHPLLTEIKDNKEKGKRWMTSTFYPPPKRRSVSAVRRYPPGCGRDPHFSLCHFKTDTTSTSNHHISPQINIPVPPHDAHHDVQTAAAGHHDHNSHLSRKEQPTENSQIHLPDVSPAQGNTTFDTKCEPLAMLQDQLLDAPAAQPHTVHTPNTQATSDAKVALNSHTSKEIVVALECVPLKGKEKVVLKKKVVAKKSTSPKSGQIVSLKKTRLVPSQISDHEDAAMDPSTTDPTPLSQRSPQVCPKKSVARPSQPCPAEGKTMKKGRRVAKKSTRLVKDESPSAQKHNSMTLTLPPVTPFEGEKLSNARGKVKKILRLFQMVCRVLLQKEESGSGKQPQKDLTGSESKSKGPNRVDLKAANIVKRSSEYVEPGNPVVGHLPGVEVGDEFRFRVELHLIGLHRPLQSGIDWTKVNGVPVATSIVASGGYSDDMAGSDVLIYTGSGGKPTGKKGQRTLPEDQKLEKGNLALKNSMDMKTPVRVIHGLNFSDRKVPMTFTYDGLYMVEEFKQEPYKHKTDGQEYITQVFKYKLKRMAGQPELGLHVATKSKKSKVREGFCVPDISQGKEKIPICAINTIDDEKPPAFKYVTSTIYPSWYEKTAPKGCDCTSKCSSSKRCLCAMKNGGEIPFNFNGAIVQAKQLIYECGPSCRCPPSCHNRVSQSGIKIPLEIFKTETRGWGVRSLSSIQSGSFVCEYVGELLRDEEAEKRRNDEYLFDIGHNYDDTALWEGLPSFVPGIGSTSAEDGGASVSEGFTIDAAEMGNVGRFINHSCSPNLYAQNVLFDHDNRRMPHVMFFAAENIPPLQELTYHYNYTIGEVRDLQGNEKVKKCYCGSLECDGRLY